MKELNIFLVIIFMAAVTFAIGLSQNSYAVDVSKSNFLSMQQSNAQSNIPNKQQGNVSNMQQSNTTTIQHQNSAVHKVELEIDADRNKIIEEGREVNVDRRKLKDAAKIADKANAEQIKKDIEAREARIKDLKKEINNKKEQRYLLMNGKQKDEPRRTKKDAK